MTEFEVPLICDEPPAGLYVLTTPRPLSETQIARLRAEWDRHCGAARSGKEAVFILEPGMSLRELTAPRQWPDAEFCAA